MAEGGGGAALDVAALSLRGPRGWVYQEVGFKARPGELVAIEGRAGSGRTSLLLTLAGRMKPTGGSAQVDGLALPKQAAKVRQFAALGPVPGVNEPDPALSVSEHLRERQLLHAPVLALPARKASAARSAEALAAAGLAPEQLPSGLRTPAAELTALQTFRLGIALALLGRPRLICVDDVDDRLHATDRAAAWQLLRSLADRGITVLAATTDTAAADGLADRIIQLSTEPAAKETVDARV